MIQSRITWHVSTVLAVAGLSAAGCIPFGTVIPKPVYTDKSIVNWESPHVSPLALSSDGQRLYAVNTPDARLEVFDVSGDAPTWLYSIPVGIDPVSVRLRTDDEAWVVNYISDSVSIVNLKTRNVVRTLSPGDEPTDVAFAAGRAFVVCAQLSQVKAYDLADLSLPIETLEIHGKEPRAIVASPDGSRLYLTIFESGNHTTLVPWESVSKSDSPYGGKNPPPNAGEEFSPAFNPDLPLPPPASIIVRKDTASGAWLDDNSHDWRDAITWDQHDHDLAIIDPITFEVSYVTELMNTNMQLAARQDGQIVVIGTDATNQVRFEPNLTGRFVHSVAAFVAPAIRTNSKPGVSNLRSQISNLKSDISNQKSAVSIVDLNPHLAEAYAARVSQLPQSQRDLSLADPRGVVFSSDSSRGYISGMGSNNVIAIDAGGNRLGQIDVGQGPTGLALDDAGQRLFVFNKFDATVSVISTSEWKETARVSMYDPTPPAIRKGRPFLYDARHLSGLGVTACGACHIDGRADQLAWDLGNPADAMKTFNQTCNRPVLNFPVGPCENWHPMKGPMTTQTLQSIIGTEPFHWRGDRENLAAFNPAFQSLLGAERQLTDEEMDEFQSFLAEIKYPPNPNRRIDNSLAAQVGNGRPGIGERLFFGKGIDLAIAKCNDCHNSQERGAGTNHFITPRNLLINPHQSIKVPQIRGQYKKTGFSRTSLENDLGFGHNHDGTIDGLVNFFHIPNFTGFDPGPVGEQQRLDIISYVFSFSTETHAGVGVQVTLTGTNEADAETIERLDTMIKLADSGDVGLIVKGRQGGIPRGYTYSGDNTFISDRADEPAVDAESLRHGDAGSELTWTIVPPGTQVRMGIDRNEDGILDGDDPLNSP